MLLIWLIIGRVLASSGSAALQKRMAARGLAPTTLFAAGIGVMAIALVPVAFWHPLSGLPDAFWIYVALTVVLDVPGNILLAKSFHEGELSVVGPMAAYKPALGLAFAAVWLGETPSTAGLLGVVVVLSGTLFLAPGGRRAGWGALKALAADPGARWRTLSIGLTAVQSVFGKAAINLSSGVDLFLAWSWGSAVVAAAIWLWIWAAAPGGNESRPATTRLALEPERGGWLDSTPDRRGWPGAGARQELRRALGQWGSIVSLAGLFLALALLSSLIFERMFVGYALALFQLSALVNVAIGRSLFAEGHTASRAFASVVMIAGAAILILAG
jgi:drug/metabolite transporter (DMT)-like permease